MEKNQSLDSADSFDNWENTLETHEPEKSAKGIIMLRKGATIIRQQTTRIKELEKGIEILGTILNSKKKG